MSECVAGHGPCVFCCPCEGLCGLSRIEPNLHTPLLTPDITRRIEGKMTKAKRLDRQQTVGCFPHETVRECECVCVCVCVC